MERTTRAATLGFKVETRKKKKVVGGVGPRNRLVLAGVYEFCIYMLLVVVVAQPGRVKNTRFIGLATSNQKQ